MNDTAFAQVLINAISDAGYQAESYSGRGMYGRTCVGVTVPRDTSPFQLAAQIIASSDDPAEMADSLSDLRVNEDSMGFDTVVYFPRVPWVEAEDDDEDAA